MQRIVAALGCLGMLLLASAFVGLAASAGGRWGFAALLLAGLAFIVARALAGPGD